MKMPNIIGVFDTDDKVVDAIHTLKKNNISIADVHSPFASHHILKELGKESRIPYGSVLAGAFAIIGTFSFIYWTSVINYPLVFGGKPTFAFPSWVVVIYLVTILLTFIGTVIIFQMRTKMNFGDKPNLVHIGSTDDKFVMIIEQKEGSTDKDVENIRKMLNDHGALEVLIDSGS